MVRRALLLLALGLLATPAVALPPFYEVFRSTYESPSGSALAGAKCATCHQSDFGGARNPYGLAVQRVLKGDRSLTAAILHQVDLEDSDGDGVSNLDEIRAGRLPGVADKPSATKPGAAPTQVVQREAAGASGEIVPLHSFHPAVVHFPIALFLFGAVLDVLGWRRKNAGLRQAARLNLLVGAAAGVVSVASGIVAAVRLGHRFEPFATVTIHLMLGLITAFGMLSIASIRLREEPDRLSYVLYLMAVVVALCATGHFGSILVFG